MQRLAVIKGHQEFTLVPWRAELLKMRGQDIAISVRGRTITMALARGRVELLEDSFGASAGLRPASRPIALTSRPARPSPANPGLGPYG